MTTVVYLGNRVVADTRATIQQEGFTTPSGESQLYNDGTVKLRTFDPGFMWDDKRDIRMIGGAGTVMGLKKFVAFMKMLQCPMEQFLMTLGNRDAGLLANIVGLEHPSSFILCLNTGESIKLVISKKSHTYKGPDNKIKAIGSGAFYFDALQDVFKMDPELVFRLAISTDKHSSKDVFIEGVYDSEKQHWTMDPEPFRYSTPVDPEMLINSFNPHIKAIFKGVLDTLVVTPTEEPSDDPEVEKNVPVKIPPTKKGAKCKT